MNIIGTTTIDPVRFYSGKICGYILWLFFVLEMFGVSLIDGMHIPFLMECAYILLAAGIAITIVSVFFLGRSTRLGLPREETSFVTHGIYRYSRNPKYLGFNAMTIASMLYNIHLITIIMGVYSIGMYHAIILGEEKFLEFRFGKQYAAYKEKVGRYL